MKTKEEILLENGIGKFSVEQKTLHQSILTAMEQFAKIKSTAFAEFISRNYQYYLGKWQCSLTVGA